jgi:hypothetical protein
VARSDIDGASPESFHSIVIDPPPGKDAPALGLVNWTSARAVERRAARSERGDRRMVRQRRGPSVRRRRVGYW